MSSVGIIANPAAGKDIRRLVAQGRFVTDEEKVNILKRVVAGLDAAGVTELVMMPDPQGLCRAALDGLKHGLKVGYLEMIVLGEERDSARAAEMMAAGRVGCLITLGGDGTNRAVAKGSGKVPLMPVSTGTNNVFPTMVEGTLAGLAAGVVARRLVDLEKVTRATRRLEVHMDGAMADMALVDVAVSNSSFVGARAIWDIDTIREVFSTTVRPASIGLSAIGAQLRPYPPEDSSGIHVRLGRGGTIVVAPIAPGMIRPVPVSDWRPFRLDEAVKIGPGPCTVAVDGERSLRLAPGRHAEVRLTRHGPIVVSVEDALRQAAEVGVFASEDLIEQG